MKFYLLLKLLTLQVIFCFSQDMELNNFRRVISMGHNEGISQVSICSNGNFAGTYSEDNKGTLWDLKSKKELFSFADWPICFSNFGKNVFIG